VVFAEMGLAWGDPPLSYNGIHASTPAVTIPFNQLSFMPLKDVNPKPVFTMQHMTNYFVTKLVSDHRAANDFKNLNKRAYPLFKDGHLQTIYACKYQNLYVIKVVCLPEMKKSLVYHVRVSLCMTSGDIKYAECGCPAGMAPTASCKHIGALGYALEEFSRLQVLPDQVSCTSQLQS
jgi:hypothetical protein